MLFHPLTNKNTQKHGELLYSKSKKKINKTLWDVGHINQLWGNSINFASGCITPSLFLIILTPCLDLVIIFFNYKMVIHCLGSTVYEQR